MFPRGSSMFILAILALAAVPRGPAIPPGAGRENPHFNAGRCGECHGRDLPEEVAAHGGLSSYYNGLCIACHEKRPVACRFHSDRTPPEGNAAFSLFPLKEGRIFCLTCHDGRIQCVEASNPAARDNPLFLRGNPAGPLSRFCFACHQPERYMAFNVHRHIDGKGQPQRKACIFCHEPARDPGGKIGRLRLKDDPDRTCAACHRIKPHPGGTAHLVSVSKLETLPEGRLKMEGDRPGIRFPSGDTEAVLPLHAADRVTCKTCHDPHGTPGETPYLLRTPQIELLCKGCHGKEFEHED